VAAEGRDLALETLRLTELQAAKLTEVRKAMQHLNEVIQENLASTNRVERVARDLDGLSGQLKDHLAESKY
jgi:methyl-accepting chemotaxis protein